MSTLVAQTISNGTVSTSSANVIQGSAKAWVNFNGADTPAIRASYNVSSITRIETGTYTITMTIAMPDTNYSVNVSGQPQTDVVVDGWVPGPIASWGGISTTQFPVRFANQTPAVIDPAAVYISVFR
jgi:hypothetical protein